MKKQTIQSFLGVLMIATLVATFNVGRQTQKVEASFDNTATVTPSVMGINPLDVEYFVNQRRISKGLVPLIHSPWLCATAAIRAPQIVVNWSHQGFDATRMCPTARCFVGENLARYFDTAEQMVNGWIMSPTHLANIEMPQYRYSCVVVYGEYEVQHFSDTNLD